MILKCGSWLPEGLDEEVVFVWIQEASRTVTDPSPALLGCGTLSPPSACTAKL